ncbi:MAG: sporulation protein YtfJ [Clostridia bacterium]|nr:sporulation protein YtfJ [Clostridia bacterium]
MNSSLEGMIETSLDSLKKIVDVNTVVGEPIKTESGTTVIPISKVSLGYVSGGTDFHTKKSADKGFAGGGGSGVTILPLGFLVIKESGNVEFLAAELKSQSGPVGSIVDLIEKSPDIVEKFKKLFSKPKTEEPAEPITNA